MPAWLTRKIVINAAAAGALPQVPMRIPPGMPPAQAQAVMEYLRVCGVCGDGATAHACLHTHADLSLQLLLQSSLQA